MGSIKPQNHYLRKQDSNSIDQTEKEMGPAQTAWDTSCPSVINHGARLPSQMMPFGEPSWRRRHRCPEAQPLTLWRDTGRGGLPHLSLSPLRGSQPCSLRGRTGAAGVGSFLEQPGEGGGGPGWPRLASRLWAVTAPHSRDGIAHIPPREAKRSTSIKPLRPPSFSQNTHFNMHRA